MTTNQTKPTRAMTPRPRPKSSKKDSATKVTSTTTIQCLHLKVTGGPDAMKAAMGLVGAILGAALGDTSETSNED